MDQYSFIPPQNEGYLGYPGAINNKADENNKYYPENSNHANVLQEHHPPQTDNNLLVAEKNQNINEHYGTMHHAQSHFPHPYPMPLPTHNYYPPQAPVSMHSGHPPLHAQHINNFAPHYNMIVPPYPEPQIQLPLNHILPPEHQIHPEPVFHEIHSNISNTSMVIQQGHEEHQSSVPESEPVVVVNLQTEPEPSILNQPFSMNLQVGREESSVLQEVIHQKEQEIGIVESASIPSKQEGSKVVQEELDIRPTESEPTLSTEYNKISENPTTESTESAPPITEPVVAEICTETSNMPENEISEAEPQPGPSGVDSNLKIVIEDSSSNHLDTQNDSTQNSDILQSAMALCEQSLIVIDESIITNSNKKKRRRIVELDDDDSEDEITENARMELLRSESPEQPAQTIEPDDECEEKEEQKFEEDENDEENITKSLFQNVILIPADTTETKRKKIRILDSDDDDEVMREPDLKDIGLQGDDVNESASILLNEDENCIAEGIEMDRMEQIVPMETPIVYSGDDEDPDDQEDQENKEDEESEEQEDSPDDKDDEDIEQEPDEEEEEEFGKVEEIDNEGAKSDDYCLVSDEDRDKIVSEPENQEEEQSAEESEQDAEVSEEEKEEESEVSDNDEYEEAEPIEMYHSDPKQSDHEEVEAEPITEKETEDNVEQKAEQTEKSEAVLETEMEKNIEINTEPKILDTKQDISEEPEAPVKKKKKKKRKEVTLEPSGSLNDSSSDDEFIPNDIYFGTPDKVIISTSFKNKGRPRGTFSSGKKSSKKKKRQSYNKDYSSSGSSSTESSSDDAARRRKNKFKPSKPTVAMVNKIYKKHSKSRKQDRFYDKSREIPNDVYFGNVNVPLHVLHSFGASSGSDDEEAAKIARPKALQYGTKKSVTSQRPYTAIKHARNPVVNVHRDLAVSPSSDSLIQRLKEYLKIAGLKKVKFSKLWEGCKSNEERANAILRLLRDKGLEGEPTVAKCKDLKFKLQTIREIRELDACVIIDSDGEGRTRRSTRSTAPIPSTSKNYENEPDILETVIKLKGVVDSDTD